MLQADHARLVHQIALCFGNDDFAAPKPHAEMMFLALNHDRGWDEVDACIQRNPDTSLPYSLVQTPMDELLGSSRRSADFNTKHHAYSGLLCSMHVWGLFNGRYGLSDKVVVDMLQGEMKVNADAMLNGELDRQATLKAELGGHSDFSEYLREPVLMQNYKALQFWDTLSLYFNAELSDAGETTTFLNVPRSSRSDCRVELKALGGSRYQLSPNPLGPKEVQLQQKSYVIDKSDVDLDYSEVLERAQSRCQTITIVGEV